MIDLYTVTMDGLRRFGRVTPRLAFHPRGRGTSVAFGSVNGGRARCARVRVRCARVVNRSWETWVRFDCESATVGIVTVAPTSIMASRAVIGGTVDARAVGAKKEDEEEEENARGGGEGIDPGLVDELYESLRDAVRGLIKSSDERIGICFVCRVVSLSNDGDGSLY